MPPSRSYRTGAEKSINTIFSKTIYGEGKLSRVNADKSFQINLGNPIHACQRVELKSIQFPRSFYDLSDDLQNNTISFLAWYESGVTTPHTIPRDSPLIAAKEYVFNTSVTQIRSGFVNTDLQSIAAEMIALYDASPLVGAPATMTLVVSYDHITDMITWTSNIRFKFSFDETYVLRQLLWRSETPPASITLSPDYLTATGATSTDLRYVFANVTRDVSESCQYDLVVGAFNNEYPFVGLALADSMDPDTTADANHSVWFSLADGDSGNYLNLDNRIFQNGSMTAAAATDVVRIINDGKGTITFLKDTLGNGTFVSHATVSITADVPPLTLFVGDGSTNSSDFIFTIKQDTSSSSFIKSPLVSGEMTEVFGSDYASGDGTSQTYSAPNYSITSTNSPTLAQIHTHVHVKMDVLNPNKSSTNTKLVYDGVTNESPHSLILSRVSLVGSVFGQMISYTPSKLDSQKLPNIDMDRFNLAFTDSRGRTLNMRSKNFAFELDVLYDHAR